MDPKKDTPEEAETGAHIVGENRTIDLPEQEKKEEAEYVRAEVAHAEAVLAPEIKKRPKLSFDIFFTAHITKEDIQGLRKRFDECDIYVPERFGWHESDIQRLNELSQGRITVDEFAKETGLTSKHPMYGMLREELQMIDRSFKPITLVDIPVFEKEIKGDALLSEIPKGKTLLETYRNVRRWLLTAATENTKREDTMLAKLPAHIEAVLAARPDLAAKEKVRTLLFLGVVHTRVFMQLKKFGQEATRTFSVMPFLFRYTNEGYRRLALGKEVDNELAARVFLENWVGNHLSVLASLFTPETAHSISYPRKLISKLSINEVEEILKQPTTASAADLLFRYLNEKGVKPPSSAEDIRKIQINKK